MDTSKEYIEMCQKATEIQLLFPGTSERYDVGNPILWLVINKDTTPISSNNIWLPRQEELQKLVDLKKNGYSFTTGLGILWNDEIGYSKEEEKEMSYYENFDSFEKQWLAFVMKEKYNKVWNAETKNWEIN